MNKTIMMIISVTIGIIVTGAVLVPVINSSMDRSRTIVNNSATNLASVIDEDTVISIDGRDILVNDVPAVITAGLLMSTDSFNIIVATENIELTYKGSSSVYFVKTCDIEIVDNVANIVFTTDSAADPSTLTFNLKWGFVLDPDGQYGMIRVYNTARNLTISNLSNVYGSNRLITTDSWFAFNGNNVELLDGTKIKADVIQNEVNGLSGAYTINVGSNGDGFTFTIDNNGSPYVVHPWIFIVPNEVVAYKSELVSMSMLTIIPIFVLIALISMVAVTIRRD